MRTADLPKNCSDKYKHNFHLHKSRRRLVIIIFTLTSIKLSRMSTFEVLYTLNNSQKAPEMIGDMYKYSMYTLYSMRTVREDIATALNYSLPSKEKQSTKEETTLVAKG